VSSLIPQTLEVSSVEGDAVEIEAGKKGQVFLEFDEPAWLIVIVAVADALSCLADALKEVRYV
jgi:hypothetical protein